ncbi:MAG: phosphopantothenate/pantothenate synthetase [Thermoplasmata archaeon]
MPEPSHPRYESLMKRHRLVSGFREGIVVPEGLIAHGRGEMFDYLLGEVSIPPALIAERAGTAFILDAQNPVISVNGNAAALGAESIVELSTVTGAKIEVNLFHWSEERASAIRSLLEKFGARNVLAEKPDAFLEGIHHDRGKCHIEGIFSADVVLIPLEDGDRAQALAEMGKTVISIDLNPLSRTSLSATVSIVDELTRAVPNMTRFARELKDNEKKISETIEAYDNAAVLRAVFKHISERFDKLSKD